LLDEHTLEHIKGIISEHGSDAWWKMDVEELLPEMYKADAANWVKGTDTMDVWFDSGSSWNGVAKARKELAYPADIYLEGSDQHRGWFQSSLLTSVAANNQAPYKTVLTHGFVLDEKGFKMSKSLGNVVNPLLVIEGGNNKKLQPAYGVDVLRLWVASVDYSGDVCIGDNIIKQTFESYRKLRNTARYLIGNLADFIPEGREGSTAVPYDELPSIDKWMLGRLSATLKEVEENSDDFLFNPATQALLRFASADLSNFYLDVAKDRMYISALDDPRRRSCQTVLHAVLEGFAKSIAPILPHMAEDIWQNLPYEAETVSIFEGGLPTHLSEFERHEEEKWTTIRNLRDDINKLLEGARTDKLVGASLEAAAYVYAPDEKTRELLDALDGDRGLVHPPEKTNGVDELRTILMLSQVNLVDSEAAVSEACEEKYVATSGTLSGCVVGVKKADGEKCARCWFYGEQLGADLGLEHTDICQRCNHAIGAWEKVKGTKFVKAVPEPEEAEQPVP
jgi:isoleucyl-tRNA synthetase